MRLKNWTILPLLGLFAAAAAAQQPSMLPYLPSSTVMAMSMPDLDTSMADFGSMPLAKMWNEQEMQNFVQDAREMVAAQIKQQLEQAKEMHKQGALPVDPEVLTQLRVKGMSFAVTQLALGMGEFGPMPKIGLMLHLEFGDSAPQWSGLLEMGLGMLAQTGKFERTEGAAGDIKIASFAPKAGPKGLEMGLHVAMVKNGLIVGTIADDVRSTIENMQKGTPVLAATEQYKASAKHVATQGAEMEAYVRFEPALDFAMKLLEMGVEMEPEMSVIDMEGVRRAVDALGLRALKSMSAASTYKDGKCVTTTYMAVPAPERKGLLAGGNKVVDMGFLKWVPKDAVSFSAMTLEPMGIYDGLVGALRAYDPKLAEEAMGHLAQMEEKVGINLRDDLFGAIGDSLITWSMPVTSMTAPPEMAILLKVNDEQKIVKVIKTICAMSEGQIELDEAEKRGVKTYQFRFNIDMQGMPMNPLESMNPSFSFNNGFLVAGFSSSDIRRVFERMKRTEDDPKNDIRTNKEFAAYASSLPEGVESISFTDWKSNFESLYQLVSSVLAFLPQSEDIPFDMQMLPDSSTLTKHMFGTLSYTKSDANGMLSTSTSPFGPEVLMLGAVAVIGAAAAIGTMRGF